MEPSELVLFPLGLKPREVGIEVHGDRAGEPSPKVTVRSPCVMDPIGEMTAAVPQQKASSASMAASAVTRSSRTSSPR